MINQEKPPLDVLAHYGKKGMKWGVINEDDSAGDSPGAKEPSASPRKAAKAQARADYREMTRKLNTPEGLVGPGHPDGRDSKEGSFWSRRSKSEKALIILGGAFVASQVAGTALKYQDAGTFKAIANRNQVWKKNLSLSKKGMDISEIKNSIVKPINPQFQEKFGAGMNCRRCTLNYELRRRGYDVKATLSKYATGQTEDGIRAAVKDAMPPWESPYGLKAVKLRTGKLISATNPDGLEAAESIFSSLKDFPDGARGELGVGWNTGGGHSVAWEIVKGKPVIFDGQSGEVFEYASQYSKYAKHVQDAAVTRLDNVELDHKWLKKWAENV